MLENEDPDGNGKYAEHGCQRYQHAGVNSGMLMGAVAGGEGGHQCAEGQHGIDDGEFCKE